MPSWQEILRQHRFILFLVVIYFGIHLPFLTRLPIFNDESIYLDWAWAHVHTPGRLFDSLFDAKQPLLLWIFSIMERMFADPLVAGRVTAVMCGAMTVVGIYFVTKKLLSPSTALLASALYIVTPIFVFYNRQALMEAAIASIGIWSFYTWLELLEKPTLKKGAIVGTILGIGIFIKLSAIIFLGLMIMISLVLLVRQKSWMLAKAIGALLGGCLVVILPLLLQPRFWQTLHTNDRYSFTLAEMLRFPLTAWARNWWGVVEMGVVFVTPVLFIGALVGLYWLGRSQKLSHRLFVLFFVAALAIEAFSVRMQTPRYLLPFLPFLVISAAYFLVEIIRNTWLRRLVLAVALVIPAGLSAWLVVNPHRYLVAMAQVTRYSPTEYIFGQTSGYGIKELTTYLKEKSDAAPLTYVFYALNLGNPENAVDLYAQKNRKQLTFFLDSDLFEGLEQAKCLTSKFQTFFVARNDELHGLEAYFVLEKTFPNPDTQYQIGLYSLKKDCTGASLSLSDTYRTATIQQLEGKSL